MMRLPSNISVCLALTAIVGCSSSRRVIRSEKVVVGHIQISSTPSAGCM